jgi:hypothetical protein
MPSVLLAEARKSQKRGASRRDPLQRAQRQQARVTRQMGR